MSLDELPMNSRHWLAGKKDCHSTLADDLEFLRQQAWEGSSCAHEAARKLHAIVERKHCEQNPGARAEVGSLVEERIFHGKRDLNDRLKAAAEHLGAARYNPLIVGGRFDANNLRPETVAILRKGEVTGSGVLLTKDVVVTAAHVLRHRGVYKVGLGPRGKQKKILFTLLDRSSSCPDVALLKLADEVADYDVKIANTPSSGEGAMIGYGGNDQRGAPDGKGCRRVAAPVKFRSQDDCHLLFKDPKVVIGLHDSGGGAFLTKGGGRYLLGVARCHTTDCPESAELPKSFVSRYSKLGVLKEWLVKYVPEDIFADPT